MYCNKCGEKNVEKANFCKNCGKELMISSDQSKFLNTSDKIFKNDIPTLEVLARKRNKWVGWVLLIFSILALLECYWDY